MRRFLAIAVLPILLVACARSGTGSGTVSSGVRGTVLAGPQCPVEVVGSPCPDVPVKDTEVQAIQEGTVVASDQTDADGRFQIPLPPGRYSIAAALGSSDLQTARPVVVTVKAGRFAETTISVDTGIR
jgi:hypothetical protein